MSERAATVAELTEVRVAVARVLEAVLDMLKRATDEAEVRAIIREEMAGFVVPDETVRTFAAYSNNLLVNRLIDALRRSAPPEAAAAPAEVAPQ